MRSVTLGTALVLSLVALSLSSPAPASPVERLARDSILGSAAPAKQSAIAKQQVKKQPVAKQSHQSAAVAKQQKTAVANQQPKKTVAATQQPKKIVVATLQNNALPAVAAEPAKRKVRLVREASAASTPQPTRIRFPALFASSDIVTEARRWIGTNPTDRDRLWCARFMNFVLERAGFNGTGSDAANSFASYGRRVHGPQVGAIAVMTRGKNGGHVGVVSGIDPSGNPIVISGNHGKKVGEGTYPRSRVYAYVRPI